MKTRLMMAMVLPMTIYAGGINPGTLAVGNVADIGMTLDRYPSRTTSEKYATDAVKMASASKVLGCGYSGGRWGLDWKAHRNWAKTVSQQSLRSEYKNRRDLLIRCIRRKY